MVDLLITTKEAQAILGVSQSKIYELLNSRGFPTVIIGNNKGRKQYRVIKEKLIEWIERGGLK